MDRQEQKGVGAGDLSVHVSGFGQKIWTAKPFVTKFSMVIHPCGPECHKNKFKKWEKKKRKKRGMDKQEQKGVGAGDLSVHVFSFGQKKSHEPLNLS